MKATDGEIVKLEMMEKELTFATEIAEMEDRRKEKIRLWRI